MAIKFFNEHAKSIVSDEDIKAIAPKAVEALHTLNDKTGEGNDFLGWVDLPTNYDKEEFAKIKKAAEYIKSNADILVVIGIGGSYLGARAVIEALTSPNYNSLKKDTPDIYFIGNSISPSALNEVVSICEGKDICVNVISKSGTTTEPAIAFRVFRDLVNSKYSKEEAAKRIFATTDKAKGTLKELSDEEGYETFVVPDDVGGRYSVLTAVGLLPIAVAGIDIDELMAGAQKAQNELCSENIDENDMLKYAAVGNFTIRVQSLSVLYHMSLVWQCLTSGLSNYLQKVRVKTARDFSLYLAFFQQTFIHSANTFRKAEANLCLKQLLSLMRRIMISLSPSRRVILTALTSLQARK